MVFPEGYPNVDPDYTPKGEGEMLPFRPGFARLAVLAAQAGGAGAGGAGGAAVPPPGRAESAGWGRAGR